MRIESCLARRVHSGGLSQLPTYDCSGLQGPGVEPLCQICYVCRLLPGEAARQQLRRGQLKDSRCLELLMSLRTR